MIGGDLEPSMSERTRGRAPAYRMIVPQAEGRAIYAENLGSQL
jgi:hypothetical protein